MGASLAPDVVDDVTPPLKRRSSTTGGVLMDKVIAVRARKVLLAAARNVAVSLGGGWEAQTAQGYARVCEQRARALAIQEDELAR